MKLNEFVQMFLKQVTFLLVNTPSPDEQTKRPIPSMDRVPLSRHVTVSCTSPWVMDLGQIFVVGREWLTESEFMSPL